MTDPTPCANCKIMGAYESYKQLAERLEQRAKNAMTRVSELTIERDNYRDLSAAQGSTLRAALEAMDAVAPVPEDEPDLSLSARIWRLSTSRLVVAVERDAARQEHNECLDELGSITLAVDGLVESDGTALERVNELVAKYDSLRKHCDALREYNQRLDAAVSGSASEWMRERDALRAEVARLKAEADDFGRTVAASSEPQDHFPDATKMVGAKEAGE